MKNIFFQKMFCRVCQLQAHLIWGGGVKLTKTVNFFFCNFLGKFTIRFMKIDENKKEKNVFSEKQ